MSAKDPKIRLVPILRDGTPGENLGPLPEPARGACAATAGLYAAAGHEPPWIGYLAVEGALCAGTCAFKAAPRAGRVEIAYHTFPGHEGRGIATAMARALVALAERTAPGIGVAAQTLPEENASTAILRKIGFRRAGIAHDPEAGIVWEWRLERQGTAGSGSRGG